MIEGIPLWVYAAIGVAISFAKMGENKRSIYALSAIVEKFISRKRVRAAVEVVIFLTIGSIISMAITLPTNATQALAAGIAWTTLTTR